MKEKTMIINFSPDISQTEAQLNKNSSKNTKSYSKTEK